MDRQIVYPGAIPLETDTLNSNKYAMVGLSKLAAAILGTSTMLNGLACVPDAPASLNVNVAAGEIYSLQNVDGTAYSSLAADTTHQIVKQGIRMDAGLLPCPAPGTAGQSINYLIQVTYTDTDSGATVLPYYNASNPAQAYSGPANSGTAQNTVRKGVCTVAVKAGIAATTGTQTTPSPDAGYVGAWVVTVANGQTTITSGNISQYAGAPFLSSSGLVVGGFQGQAFNTSAAGGTADALTGSFTPGIAALTNGMTLFVRAASANATTTPTFTPANGTITAKTIVKGNGLALAAGDIAGAGHWIALQYDSTLDKWVMMNPATGISISSLPPVSVRQSTLASPVDTNGLPTFLPATSASLSITSQNLTSGTPLIVAAANGFSSSGSVDRLGYSSANLTWSGLTANVTNYLYVDVAANGTLTPGSTTLAPVYQQGGTPSTTSGQATFNIAQMQMFVGNGSSAPQAYRVFVGEAVAGASTITSTVAYSLLGRYQVDNASIAINTTYNHNHNLGTDFAKVRLLVANGTYGWTEPRHIYNASDLGEVAGNLLRNSVQVRMLGDLYFTETNGGTNVLATKYRILVERAF